MHPSSGKKGQSLVEFAILLPVVLLLVLGIVEFARAWFYTNAINNGVRAGLRYASELGSPSIQKNDSRVQDYVFGAITSNAPGTAGNLSVTTDLSGPITLPSGKQYKMVTITASYDSFQLITGNMLQNIINLSGTAIIPDTFTLQRSGTMYYERATF